MDAEKTIRIHTRTDDHVYWIKTATALELCTSAVIVLLAQFCAIEERRRLHQGKVTSRNTIRRR